MIIMLIVHSIKLIMTCFCGCVISKMCSIYDKLLNGVCFTLILFLCYDVFIITEILALIMTFIYFYKLLIYYEWGLLPVDKPFRSFKLTVLFRY